MLVSVIIPNFNKASFLCASISSALDQDYRNIEVIVVDDASTDESSTIVKNFRDKRVRFVELPTNMGVSVARNIGMSIAKGEFIALLDSDDIWHKSKISIQVQHLVETGTRINYCGGIETDPDGIVVRRFERGFNGDISKEFHKGVTKGIIALGGSSIIFSRALLASVGFFDPSMRGPSEDWDFFRRLSKAAEVSYISKSLVQYRRLDSGRSSVNLVYYRSENLYAVKKMIQEENFSKCKEVWILLGFNLLYFIFFLRTKSAIPLFYKLLTDWKMLSKSRKKRLYRWHLSFVYNAKNIA